MVYCLEDLLIQFVRLLRFEGHAQDHESIRKALHAETSRAMTHVGVTCLRNGVVVDVDNTVQVEGHNLGNNVKLIEVVYAILDESREGKGGKVADCGLIRIRVFDDLSA